MEHHPDSNAVIDLKILADEQRSIGLVALQQYRELTHASEQGSLPNLIAGYCRALQGELIRRTVYQAEHPHRLKIRQFGAGLVGRSVQIVHQEYVPSPYVEAAREALAKIDTNHPLYPVTAMTYRLARDISTNEPTIALVSNLTHEHTYLHGLETRREGFRLEYFGQRSVHPRTKGKVVLSSPGNPVSKLHISRFTEDVVTEHYATVPIVAVSNSGEVHPASDNPLDATEDEQLHALGILIEFAGMYGVSAEYADLSDSAGTTSVPLTNVRPASRRAWYKQIYGPSNSR